MAPVKPKKNEIEWDALRKLNERLAFLLEECENGTRIDSLTKNQYEEIWSKLYEVLKEKVASGGKSNGAIIKACLELLNQGCRTNVSAAGGSESFVKLLTFFNEKALELSEISDRNVLCKVNELWLNKADLPVVPGMERFTLRHLISLALPDKPLPSDLNRLSAFRKRLNAAELEDPANGFVPFIVSLVQNPNVVASTAGQRFLGHVGALSGTLMGEIHLTTLKELASCEKRAAIGLGKMYMIAWYEASDEVKDEIQDFCQQLINLFYQLPRKSLELSKSATNVLSAIDIWNVEARKKGSPNFVTMICDSYRPILWKGLQSGYHYQRCNAFDLFFKTFPVQTPENDTADPAELFELQCQYMESALRDNCYVIRIIAVREICNILSVYWAQFSPTQIQRLLTIVTKENACDASSIEVRDTVWVGFISLLSSPTSYEYAKQILPSLSGFFYDVSQKVRIRFLRLLVAIRDKNDPNFKYTAIIETSAIVTSLALEKAAVGRWIVRLILPKLYSTEMETRCWIKKFVLLIKNYPLSYRNFFMFSGNIITLADALNIMCSLMSYLGAYVKERLELVESDENQEPNIIKRKRNSNSIGQKRPSETSVSSQNCVFEDPAVVTGLFDIITILWVLHEEHLLKPENNASRVKLLDTYVEFAQRFIVYYKESSLLTSIITMSGNVPMSLLKTYSITLPGYCMKQLKVMTMGNCSTDESRNASMLMALVKWGQGSVILDQVSLWIEAAFDSIKCESSEKPTKRVKILETIKPNSILAIHILNQLMRTEHIKASIMRKNYAQLVELWKLLSNIKELIYRRLLRGVAYSEPLLSDEFLSACFKRYVMFIPLLHRTNEEEQPEDSFNGPTEIGSMLNWTVDDLLPLLQAEECPDIELLAFCINQVLEVCDNMITCHLTKPNIYPKLGQCIISLLTTDHELHFIKVSSRMATALNYSAKIMNIENDNLQIWSVMVPSIFSHTLNAMVSRQYSVEKIEQFKPDFQMVKTNFCKILATYEESFERDRSKERMHQVKLLMQKLLQALRVVLSREVPRKDLSVPVYSSITELPPIATTLLSMVYNKNFWSPMFLFVLKENLGHSLKIFLIDILLLNLFGKLKNEKCRIAVESIKTLAKSRLAEWKGHRESGEFRNMGVLLHGEENELIEGVTNRLSSENDPVRDRRSDNVEENTKTMTSNQPSQHQSNLNLSLTPTRLEMVKSKHVPEVELIDDFIRCGNELLDQILVNVSA